MGTTPSIAGLLAVATELFTWVFTSLATVISTITSNPLLLMGFMYTLVGLVIGVFKRVSNIS